MLYSIEVPKAGGHTLFANQYAAYDELSDAMKRRIVSLTGSMVTATARWLTK